MRGRFGSKDKGGAGEFLSESRGVVGLKDKGKRIHLNAVSGREDEAAPSSGCRVGGGTPLNNLT